MALTLRLSNPKALITDEKFCLPEPIVMRGTFTTDTNIITILALTQTAGIATATYTDPHGYQDGQDILFSGALQPKYNGWKQITYIDDYTISFYVESSAASPATGTPTSTRNICSATGTGTLAGTDFVSGDYFYIPSLDELRQVGPIRTPIYWDFVSPFTSDVTDELIRKAARGVYKGVAVKNIGEADGTYKEFALTVTDLAESNFDQAGLEPVCGDATGTLFKINIQ